MKRSTMVILGATGMLAAGAWLGRSTGPLGNDEPANVYDSVSACITANAMSREACETEFEAASERHLKEAPRFAAQTDCEAKYGAGQCKPATIAGTSYFLPALVGFMVAQRLMNQRQAQPLLPPAVAQQPCPPGATAANNPACAPRSSTGSSGGSSAFSSGRSYSTTRGTSITRSSNSTSIVLPRSNNSSFGTSGRGSPSPNASPSVSRGGFGSTARSTSSSSSS
ncbi:Biofilm formation YgiB [Rhabdaerophilaceae bacterium]